MSKRYHVPVEFVPWCTNRTVRILKKTLRPKSIKCISDWTAYDVLAVPNLGPKALMQIMLAGEMAGVGMKDDQMWFTWGFTTGGDPFYPYTTYRYQIPPLTQQRYLKRRAEDLTTARLKVWFKDTYKLVLWPESQAYMDKPWFDDHAILADAEYIGEGQAYFIPIERIKP